MDKLNLYDTIGGLIPGTLLVAGIAVLFPSLGAGLAAGLPDAFLVAALLAASLVGGLFVQTIGSMCEWLLFKIFGGRPSDLALQGRLRERYLPKDAAKRIRETLAARFGSEASDHSLFLRALTEAESCDTSRAKAFNAQYGYLRSIVFLIPVLLLSMIASRFWGRASSWTEPVFWLAIGGLLALDLLFAWRAWQRGVYYAREVLLTAERLERNRSAPPTPTDHQRVDTNPKT